MNNLFDLFWMFFRLGLFTIGGGYAMIPLINQELVGTGLLTQAQALDMIAISQMTPGPLAINAATFGGMRVAGVLGAVTCTVAIVLPSMILCTLAGHFFFQFQKSKWLQAALKGMRPAVVALILSSSLVIAKQSFLTGTVAQIDWIGVAICVASAGVVFGVKKFPPALLIVISGVLGAIFLR
jgi:chromate transporter